MIKKYTKTQNLFDINGNWTGAAVTSPTTIDVEGDSVTITSSYYAYISMPVTPNTTYTASYTGEGDRVYVTAYRGQPFNSSNQIGGIQAEGSTFDSGNTEEVYFLFYAGSGTEGTTTYSDIMLNEGSTALPYQPFGNDWQEIPYKINVNGEWTESQNSAKIYEDGSWS